MLNMLKIKIPISLDDRATCTICILWKFQKGKFSNMAKDKLVNASNVVIYANS